MKSRFLCDYPQYFNSTQKRSWLLTLGRMHSISSGDEGEEDEEKVSSDSED